MMQIKIAGMLDDPYAQSLLNMAELEFPGSAVSSPCAVFEAVTKELIGTKQHRYGPTPGPEALVTIRNVVRYAMDHGKPIPILVPWGGSKQGNGSVDIAELMALKQLNSLVSRIKAHYPVGAVVRIRLEDATDNLLFADFPGWKQKTAQYTQEFSKLALVIGDLDVSVLPETKLVSPSFESEARLASAVIYLAMRDGSTGPLSDIGWRTLRRH